MATATYLNGTITAGQIYITLAAYTALGAPPNAQRGLLKFATGEQCLITDESLAPTIGVVRGYRGSAAAAHSIYEGVVYGLTSDAVFAGAVPFTFVVPTIVQQSQDVIATGATGSTAAPVVIGAPGFINANSSGASGAGLNLPIPVPGNVYTVKNNMTGALKVYSVGATIDGTTGTTAYSITATGDLGATFACSVAGAWQVVPLAS